MSHLDVVTQAVADHLKRLGMKNIQYHPSDTVTFHGDPGSWFDTNCFDMKVIIGKGSVRISTEGSRVIAHYLLQPGTAFTLGTLGVFIVWPMMILQWGRRFLMLTASFVIPILLGGVFFFIPSLGLKKELIRAFQTAQNMIEAQVGNLDFSAVEPEHINQNPENLLRTGYYYWNQGQREKGNHYFAYLIAKYPWTEEAVAALQKLKSSDPRTGVSEDYQRPDWGKRVEKRKMWPVLLTFAGAYLIWWCVESYMDNSFSMTARDWIILIGVAILGVTVSTLGEKGDRDI